MDSYMGMITAFGFSFVPQNWMACNGQLISIAQNTALYSLLGITYGGDGVNTFALPDLQGRSAVGIGQGKGLSNYVIGEAAGNETTTLSVGNLPAHNHTMMASSDGATSNNAAGASLASNPRGGTMPNIYEPGAANQVPMASGTGATGSGQPFNQLNPFLALNFCICVQGIYPPRN